ncbi:YdcF family protein [Candidatus Gracilibacteria bacterium]|nr:YdcF family protein [Candidatus Gracilibacteria bacterium]
MNAWKKYLLGFLGLITLSGMWSAIFVMWHYDETFQGTVLENGTDKKICAVIFGAAVWKGDRPSHALSDRLFTGIDLYQEGKVNCLVLSGSVSELGASHEVEIMKELVLEKKIPLEDLVLDFEGENTLATIKNLPAGVNLFVFVSNDFHLARIKLLAQKEGIDGFFLQAATYQKARYTKEPYFFFREVVANIWYALS